MENHNHAHTGGGHRFVTFIMYYSHIMGKASHTSVKWSTNDRHSLMEHLQACGYIYNITKSKVLTYRAHCTDHVFV